MAEDNLINQANPGSEDTPPKPRQKGSLDGPDMLPYQLEGEAQGGWVQSPSDTAGTPRAVGGESILAPRFPQDGGGRGYAITALRGAGTNAYGYADPNQLVDNPGEKPWYDSFGSTGTSALSDARKPTTQAIIHWASEQAAQKVKNGGGGNKRPYKYTDFVFCKYWNKIPNNYMLTLRRYPFPVFDNIEFPGENGSDKDSSITPSAYYSPITQAITFMGDDPGNGLSDMMKYTAKLPYKDNESKIHSVTAQTPGADAGPAPGLAKVLGVLSGGADFNSISKGGQAPPDPYSNGPYMNRIYGPVNVIKKTKQREQGLNFEQSFALKFHYVARPIGGVNTKAIMLDIMANLLVLCYAEGSFWGGAHRFTGGKPQYPFLGGKAGMQALYSGDIGGFVDAFTDQLTQAASNVSDIFNSVLANPVDGLKKLAAGGAKLGLAKQLAKKRMSLQQIPSLLTGNPVGEWHLTVGNPFNPIMEIGNLVCTGVDFEFGKELGPDDFPLEMTATVKLEHGMPRDKAGIESMFNRGGGKIYHLPDNYQFGTESGGTNPNAGNTPVDKGSAKGTGGKTSSEAKGKGQSVNKGSILQGNATQVDQIGKSVVDGGQHIYETVKIGFGYYNKPEST